MPAGIDAALGKLAGMEPKMKKFNEPEKKKVIAAPTVDLRAEGLEGCKKRVSAQNAKIAALQSELGGLPPTKANKPKKAQLEKDIAALQQDPNYRGALTIVRDEEEKEREKRRAEREKEEEEVMMGIKKAPKDSGVSAAAAAVAKATPKAAAKEAESPVEDGPFDLDGEVQGVVNSAVENSTEAQEKLAAGPGRISYLSEVKDEVASMAFAAVEKLAMSIKRAGLRDGSLRTVRSLLWNPPAVLPSLPTMLILLEETKLKSEPMGSAVDLATKLSTVGPGGKAMPELVLPVLLAHLGTAAGGKWKVKVGTIGVLKSALLRMQEPDGCPWQLGLLMPQVTKALREAVGDARKEVKKAAEELLLFIAREMVVTPEIKAMADELIGSIIDSANMQKAADALHRLANTTFMNTVDAASFALLFPVVVRAMRETVHDAKKKGVQIVGASVNLIASPEFLSPYLVELVPLLKECLMHPTHDVEREAAKTFGMLAAGLPDVCENDIYPYLLEKLESKVGLAEESEVERRGAAHGLSEVLLQRREMLQSCLNDVMLPRIAQGSSPETKAGALAVFHFLPHLGNAAFLPHLDRCLPVILNALREETEVVTKQAKEAVTVLLEEYAAAFPKIMLPHLQYALFYEEEDARDLAMQLFFGLCDKLQEAVKFGQDFLSMEMLNTVQKHSLLSSIYIARTDENPAVRRNATLLWKERVQSGQKAKAEIMPHLLSVLKGLQASGKPARVAAAEACIAEMKTSKDLEGVDFNAVQPLSADAATATADSSAAASADADEVKAPVRRKELIEQRVKDMLRAATIPPPLRRYVEAVSLSCCLEAKNAAEAQQFMDTELKPLAPKSAPGEAAARFGLAALPQKAFEGLPEVQSRSGGPAGPKGKSADSIVYVDNLMLMYGGGKVLLKDTVLELCKGHRYGVVGRNGVGKTTLMNTIATGGISQIPKSVRTLHVRPEVLVAASDLTAVQFCKKDNLETENVSEEALHAALAKVGFPLDMQEKSVQELSGGWRMKLLIASAMLRECDILLLDEPTNHLDVASVEWLATYLCSLTNTTAMVISHDAGFLNRICTDIIHYSGHQTLEYYDGNFDAFRKVRNITSDEEAEALLLGHDIEEMNFNPPDREKGEKAEKGAKDEKEGADEPEEGDDGVVKARLLDKAAKISFPIPGKLQGHSSAKPVLELRNVSFAYDEDTGPLILSDVSCKLGLSSRVGIVGANGAGKSTMLNLICGELQPSPGADQKLGEVYKHRNLRLAYIAQQHMFHLSEFLTSPPYVYVQKRFKNGYDEALQERLTKPANEEHAKLRKQLALRWGKYGKQVKNVVGRTFHGNELRYEVEWEELDDPKQNTHEPVSKLKKLDALGFAKAYDERQAAQTAGIDQRPLSSKEIVKHFDQFGLDEDMVMNRNIEGFSAGQKSKLTLGAAFWVKPHVIALDEPTNYIDMETLDALGKALQRFKGAVLVISHSQQFVDSVCNELWHVAGTKVTKEVKGK
mmetsp:Transcript_87833/g.284317  ORF Transcript_87833/g.284317 Transcript_87833/m.284317 type:complete len:1490 (+) Transcript_87833:154-4623(+)